MINEGKLEGDSWRFWARVPVTSITMNITCTAFRLYCYLISRADKNTCTCWPSVKTMAEDMGKTKVTIYRGLKDLQDANLIIRIDRENTSSLTLVFASPAECIEYKDENTPDTNNSKDPEYLENVAAILAGRDSDISKQKSDAQKERVVKAIATGEKNHRDMQDRWFDCFTTRPNWDTKANGKSLRFLIDRAEHDQMIERFAEWWDSDDWRREKALPPVPSKVVELWAQAFDKPTEGERLRQEYPNMQGAYD